jgi:chemotaxis protein methyltransferase CheR
VRTELKRNVSFFQHDLVSDGSFAEMHVVFCRNVLIYLSEPLKGTVLRGLADSLVPGGYLCLGRSERPEPACDDFAVVLPGEQIYRRVEGRRAGAR